MQRRHPHSDATYRVLQLKDATFGVEVTIPDTNPTTVTNFATEAEAEKWIAQHRESVAKGDSLRRRFLGGSKF